MTLREVWGNDINIFLGDFNCEEYWSTPDELQIPHVDLSHVQSYVRNMDELLIYMAGPDDIVILRNQPDPAFLSYLESYHIQLPYIFSISDTQYKGPISEQILREPNILDYLLGLSNNDSMAVRKLVLRPYGLTSSDEKLGKYIHAPIPYSSQLAAELNNKQTLRYFMKEFGLPMPQGHLCQSSREIIRTGNEYIREYGSIVLKELHSAGGAGLAILDSEVKLWKLLDLCEPIYHKKILLERWCEVKASYNIQFYIENGRCSFYSFSRQTTEKGKIKGSNFETNQNKSLEHLIIKHTQATKPLVDFISKCGYAGIVGFDSIICRDGEFYPIIDINCRINLSTIFKEIANRYFTANVSLFFYVDFRSRMKIEFSKLYSILNPFHFTYEKGEGAVILNFTTVNISRNIDNGYGIGRVYIGVFCDSQKRANELHKKIVTQLCKG